MPATTMRDKLANYGVWTYRAAWVLEVVAAMLGVSTGLVLGYQAFAASESVTSMELILASAPFFMVALAELTKIPIATLLFTTSWLWKPIVLLFLVALAGITFETVFMGLERAATLRQLQYEHLAEQISALETEATNLNASTEQAREVDLVAQAQAEFDQLLAQSTLDRKGIEEQIAALEREIQTQASLSPDAVRIREELLDEKEARDRQVVQQQQKLDSAIRQFESQRDSYVERARVQRESGDLPAARLTEEELRALANPRRRMEEEHRLALAPLDERIGVLQSEFDRLAALSPPMTEVQLASIRENRAELVSRLDRTLAGWSERLADARTRLGDAQASEATEAQTVAGNQQRLSEIGKQLSGLEAERIPMARSDQTRRIAGRFFGLKPEDVTEDQAGLISVIWFGSLALLAALAGPITAMVALALQKHAASPERPQASKLARLVRRILLNWRWHRIKRVEVPVEVPLEKEVEKRVEVPVEVVVKEILYVPVLTDDPEMVMRSLKQGLPPEVSELVATSVRGKSRADKAQHVPT